MPSTINASQARSTSVTRSIEALGVDGEARLVALTLDRAGAFGQVAGEREGGASSVATRGIRARGGRSWRLDGAGQSVETARVPGGVFGHRLDGDVVELRRGLADDGHPGGLVPASAVALRVRKGASVSTIRRSRGTPAAVSRKSSLFLKVTIPENET